MKLIIGAIILHLRKEHKMTQAKLASILNVSDKAVSKWETNTAYPGIDQLVRMAKLFHTSVDVLLGLKEYCENDANINSSLADLCEKFDLPLEAFQVFIQEIPCCLFFKNMDLKYQLVSHTWEEILIDRKDWSVIGKNDFEVFRNLELAKLYNDDDLEIIETGKESRFYGEFPCEDGIIRYFQIIKKPVFNTSGQMIGIMGIVNDITEMKTVHKHMGLPLITDQLTGAYNRSYYEQFLAMGIQTQQMPFSFIKYDFKNLKEINELYGKLKVNQLLIQTINLIRSNLQEEYPIIRMSYDEFLILCPNYNSQKCRDLIELLERKQKKLIVSNPLLNISFSVSTVNTMAELLKNAIENTNKF